MGCKELSIESYYRFAETAENSIIRDFTLAGLPGINKKRESVKLKAILSNHRFDKHIRFQSVSCGYITSNREIILQELKPITQNRKEPYNGTVLRD